LTSPGRALAIATRSFTERAGSDGWTTITSEADAYAREVAGACREAGLRTELDLDNEKINYKVRRHSLGKVPLLLVLGRREASERLVSVRRLGAEKQEVLALDTALDRLAAEAAGPLGAAKGARGPR